MDFETWFFAEVDAGRLYHTDKEVALRGWDGAVEQSQATEEITKARLQFLIDNEAAVSESFGCYRVFRTMFGDSEELTPYNKETGGCGWKSAEEAIDAARKAGEVG